MWRRRRWRFLRNVVDGLPSNSHLGQAVSDDPENVDLSAIEQPWRPTIRHHSEDSAVLVAIHDVLQTLVAVQAEKYKPVYLPRPHTARDDVLADLRRHTSSKVRDKLFPPIPQS